jgi:hypothetical protein
MDGIDNIITTVVESLNTTLIDEKYASNGYQFPSKKDIDVLESLLKSLEDSKVLLNRSLSKEHVIEKDVLHNKSSAFLVKNGMEFLEEKTKEMLENKLSSSVLEEQCRQIDKRNSLAAADAMESLFRGSEDLLVAGIELEAQFLEKSISKYSDILDTLKIEFQNSCSNFSFVDKVTQLNYDALKSEYASKNKQLLSEASSQTKLIEAMQANILQWHSKKLTSIVGHHSTSTDTRNKKKEMLSRIDGLFLKAADATLERLSFSTEQMDERESLYVRLEDVRRDVHRWKMALSAEVEELLDITVSRIEDMQTEHISLILQELMRYREIQDFCFSYDKQLDQLLRFSEILNETETANGALSCRYEHLHFRHHMSSAPLGTRVKTFAELTGVPPHEIEDMLKSILMI